MRKTWMVLLVPIVFLFLFVSQASSAPIVNHCHISGGDPFKNGHLAQARLSVLCTPVAARRINITLILEKRDVLGWTQVRQRSAFAVNTQGLSTWVNGACRPRPSRRARVVRWRTFVRVSVLHQKGARPPTNYTAGFFPGAWGNNIGCW